MIWALVFPYLPLRERASVNGWTLTPISQLDEETEVAAGATPTVQGLLRLYGIDDERPRLGAFARHSDGRIGEEFEAAAIPPLRLAVMAAMLDMNPSPFTREDERSGDEAFASATSDNALAWGHRIDDDGWVAAEYGFMVPTLSGGYNVHHEDSIRFQPPPDLHRPLSAGDLDDEYAAELHRRITDGTDEGRRLGRALEWLDLAWRNASSMNMDVRIFALRAGFEVLFDSDNTFVVRDRLSALLDDSGTPRTRREWTSREGNQQAAQLTDLAWWFQRFAFLRNAIAHGGDIESDRYTWDGVSHLLHAELHLRESVREIVIRDGKGDLRLSPIQRRVQRYLRESGAFGSK